VIDKNMETSQMPCYSWTDHLLSDNIVVDNGRDQSIYTTLNIASHIGTAVMIRISHKHPKSNNNIRLRFQKRRRKKRWRKKKKIMKGGREEGKERERKEGKKGGRDEGRKRGRENINSQNLWLQEK
jgi:hypothetical protein